MLATVKLDLRSCAVSQSTFFLELQNTTACEIVSESYRSQSVSNFHSSFSTRTENWRIPSSVRPSRRIRIRSGSAAMNRSAMSRTSRGSVADTRTVCVEAGRRR